MYPRPVSCCSWHSQRGSDRPFWADRHPKKERENFKVRTQPVKHRKIIPGNWLRESFWGCLPLLERWPWNRFANNGQKMELREYWHAVIWYDSPFRVAAGA